GTVKDERRRIVDFASVNRAEWRVHAHIDVLVRGHNRAGLGPQRVAVFACHPLDELRDFWLIAERGQQVATTDNRRTDLGVEGWEDEGVEVIDGLQGWEVSRDDTADETTLVVHLSLCIRPEDELGSVIELGRERAVSAARQILVRWR